MKKPSKQRVVAAIKSDHEYGKKRLIGAVEFTSGTMVVEYESRQRVSFGDEERTHIQHRILVEPKGASGPSSVTSRSYFEEDE